MGAHITVTVILWVVGLFCSIGGGAVSSDDSPSGAFFTWVGGMITMLAIWESWVLYRFYMVPLGL